MWCSTNAGNSRITKAVLTTCAKIGQMLLVWHGYTHVDVDELD